MLPALSIVWVLPVTSAAPDARPGGVRTGKAAALDARLAERIGVLSVEDRGRVAACVRAGAGGGIVGVKRDIEPVLGTLDAPFCHGEGLPPRTRQLTLAMPWVVGS